MLGGWFFAVFNIPVIKWTLKIAEIEKMTVNEYNEWVAYFNIAGEKVKDGKWWTKITDALGGPIHRAYARRSARTNQHHKAG